MKPIYTTEKVIGDTTYIVENVFSEHARESACDKIKKLILRDACSLAAPMDTKPVGNTALMKTGPSAQRPVQMKRTCDSMQDVAS